MRRLLPYTFLFVLSVAFNTVKAQSCFNINAGKDTSISCQQACLNLTVKVPDVKSSEDYKAIPIAYNPYPFVNANGVEYNRFYEDDRYSGEIILPFTFCFYGQNYTSCVVGTNGIVTFDIATNKNKVNAYILDSPIPRDGGVPDDQNEPYYPRAAIMGPYHDIDPDPATTSPQQRKRKMEYIIQGNAPCRKFVLNFYEIPYFLCPNEIITQQMVLYEGTGIIDIFIEKKPVACSMSTNDGTAILGIQNWERNKAVVASGRNNTIWAANKEGWRFVPNGTTSLLSRVQLYKNNILIGTGTTVNLGTGELEATFTNVCQSEDSMSYVVRAFYKKCDNPAIETEGSDTVIVYKPILPLIATHTPILCNGSLSTITVTSPVGPGIQYSINGGASWQNSTVFTKSGGNYTILTRGGNTHCATSGNVIVNEPLRLSAVSNSNNTTCAGNDGKIIITATGGTPAYEYSVNNGATYQNSNTFLLQPGNYNNIKIKDANGCLTNTSSAIAFVDEMFLALTTDTTVCSGSPVILNTQTNNQTTIFNWAPATGLNNPAIKNPVATPADTVTYTLLAQWGVCRRTATTTLNILRKPIVNAGKDTIICNNTSAFLQGAITNLSGTVNYKWMPALFITPANSLTAVTTPPNSQLYTLAVTDNYGCNFIVKDEVLVTVRPAVKAFAGNDTNAVYGIPHQLLGNGGINYTWKPSSPLVNSVVQNPLATLYADTYFTLTVTNDIGCSDADEVLIKVYKGPAYYIPNAFTPNADGVNDVLKPISVGIAATNDFRIFNRFGQVVFETREIQKGWNGMFKGKKADAGTYIWMINGTANNGKIIEMKGSVLLIQ
jgi:gliding motility-associated-like protein